MGIGLFSSSTYHRLLRIVVGTHVWERPQYGSFEVHAAKGNTCIHVYSTFPRGYMYVPLHIIRDISFRKRTRHLVSETL